MSKEVIDELFDMSLDNAAVAYDHMMYGKPVKGLDLKMTEDKASEFIINAFKAGAEWQKEQYKEMISKIDILCENYSINEVSEAGLLSNRIRKILNEIK